MIAGQTPAGLSQQLGGLPAPVAHQVLQAVRVSLATGINRGFLFGFALAVLGLVATLFLPEIPLRGTIQDQQS